jgi:hypothetical protein
MPVQVHDQHEFMMAGTHAYMHEHGPHGNPAAVTQEVA